MVNTVFIRIMEIQCKFAKNNNFALIFGIHFGNHHQRQREGKRERVYKGEMRQLGIGERGQEKRERVVNDQKPKKGWAPPPLCKTNCQSIVLKTVFIRIMEVTVQVRKSPRNQESQLWPRKRDERRLGILCKNRCLEPRL